MEESLPPNPAPEGSGNTPEHGGDQAPTGQPAPELPQQYQQYQQYGYQQPAWQQAQTWQQQQAQQQAQQQPTQQQTQQYGQQYGQPVAGQPAPVQTPYGYYQPPGGNPYTSGYYFYGQPAGPGNDVAIASLTTAGCSIGALIFTAGVSAPLSLIASIVAVVLGVKGKNAVDAGKTRMHRDVARSGFWVGIAGIVLSVIATAAWVAIIVFGINASDTPTDPGDLAALLNLLPF